MTLGEIPPYHDDGTYQSITTRYVFITKECIRCNESCLNFC